jgi:hypothetical protein
MAAVTDLDFLVIAEEADLDQEADLGQEADLDPAVEALVVLASVDPVVEVASDQVSVGFVLDSDP